MRQQFGNARLIRLGADEPEGRMLLRLPQKMLARAEAHFQPDVVDRHRKVGLRIGVLAKPQRQRGKQLLAQSLLPRGGLGALAAPVEKFLATLRRRRHATARFRLSARSVFSQEKPPSESGARPKWP